MGQGTTPRQMVKNAKEVTFEFKITEKEEVSKILDQLDEGGVNNESYKINTKEKKRTLIVCPNDKDTALKIFGIFWENEEFKNKPNINCSKTTS